MCDHCGCRQVGAIGELMDEHAVLLGEGHAVRDAVRRGDRRAARELLAALAGRLDRHVRREETGLFTALREERGEVADEVAALEGEHRSLHDLIEGLDPERPDFDDRVLRFLDDLAGHAEREDVGIFPVSVVTLGAAGWRTVDEAHARIPSFLGDAPTSVPTS